MTKSEALSFFGGSVSKLAEALKIGPSAVSMWDDARIPELRAYQIRELIQSEALESRGDVDEAAG